MRLFFRLKWFIRLEWRSYLLGILALLGVAMLGLIPPIMIGRFANLISERALSGATFGPIIVWIAIATVGQYLLRFGWSYFIWGDVGSFGALDAVAFIEPLFGDG